jgi:hypothetical protein
MMMEVQEMEKQSHSPEVNVPEKPTVARAQLRISQQLAIVIGNFPVLIAAQTLEII